MKRYYPIKLALLTQSRIALLSALRVDRQALYNPPSSSANAASYYLHPNPTHSRAHTPADLNRRHFHQNIITIPFLHAFSTRPCSKWHLFRATRSPASSAALSRTSMFSGLRSKTMELTKITPLRSYNHWTTSTSRPALTEPRRPSTTLSSPATGPRRGISLLRPLRHTPAPMPDLPPRPPPLGLHQATPIPWTPIRAS